MLQASAELKSREAVLREEQRAHSRAVKARAGLAQQITEAGEVWVVDSV